jgi:hypothetical protein
MVDFSKDGEVKRWLDAIEAARRRREVAVAMAARAALRVAPLLGRELTHSRRTHGEILSAIVLPCLRAAAAPWVAGKYPTHGDDLRVAAAAADNAALAAAFAVAASDAAVRAVASSAAAACAASGASDAAAALAASDGAAALAATYADARAAAYVDAFASDAALIDSGRSGAELTGMPLWPNGAPGWASGAWRTLKSALLAADQGWEVWTDWYDARLAGDAASPPIEALEVARATIPDEKWKQGPAAVNAEIRRLIDQFDPQRDALSQRLDKGAIEIRSANALMAWIDEQDASAQRDFAMIIAARAALRSLPTLSALFVESGFTNPSSIVLSSLRALILPWASIRFPTLERSFAAADAAADGAALFATARDESGLRAVPGVAAAYAAVDAYVFSLRASGIAGSRHGATYRSFIASASRATDLAVVAYLPSGIKLGQALWSAVSADIGALASGRSAFELSQDRLWPNEGAPYEASQHWATLMTKLKDANQDWDVWFNWYQRRIEGPAMRASDDIERAYVEVPLRLWDDGPAQVNRWIKNRIAELQGLQQRPAAFQFHVVDDKIDALPEDARPIDAETARDFYDEAKRKGQDLGDRLQRAQADENIRAHVDLLLARLGSSYAEMRPGLMISVLRSLESDVRAYDSEEGRKELAAAHLSSIFNLTESVRDLCAIFPRSREIEAEAVSLGLPMQRLPEIRETIDLVVAKVNHSDGATEGGREAVNASAAGLAHQRGLAEEAKQSAYFLVDFANFTRAGIRHLKASGRAVGGEIAGLGADSWRAIRRGAPKGVERGAAQAGKALVVGGVAVLMHWLGSDIAALGAMVGPYLPLHEMLEKMTGAALHAPAPEPDADSTSSEDADAEPAPRPSKRRKPNACKPGKT